MNSRIDFPQESIDLARDVSKRYKRRSKSRRDWACDLYDGKFLEFHYGFDEALKKGNCGPYLHEIDLKAECFSRAAADYLVARELGLKPKFYWVVGMKDLKPGENSRDKGTYDHAFITVEIQKGKEQITDPLLSLWGEVKSLGNGEIEVYHDGRIETKKRKYTALMELGQEEIIEKLEKNRSKEGGRLTLSTGESVKSCGRTVLITYNPETNNLSSKINFEGYHLTNEPYHKSIILKLETKVEENGNFDFLDGNFIAYNSGATGWSNNMDEQEPIIFPTSIAEISWNLFDEIINKARIRKNGQGISEVRSETIIEGQGLNYDFSYKPNSLAEKIILENFEERIDFLKNQQQKSVEDFLGRAKKDEVTWRVFLRDAQYFKAREEKINPNDPLGLVYSNEEHEDFLINLLEIYRRHLNANEQAHLDVVEFNADFKKGVKKNLWDRYAKVEINFEKNRKLFNNLCGLRKLRKEPYAYNIEADRLMFQERFDIVNDPIPNLENGLTEEDLLKASKEKSFRYLNFGNTERKVLFVKSYHRGLIKILDRT